MAKEPRIPRPGWLQAQLDPGLVIRALPRSLHLWLGFPYVGCTLGHAVPQGGNMADISSGFYFLWSETPIGKRIFHSSHGIESHWLRPGHMASLPTTEQCIHRPGQGLLLMPGAGTALTRSGSDGLKLGDGWAPRRLEGSLDRRNGCPL